MFHVEHSTWEKSKIFCTAQLFPTKIWREPFHWVLVDCVVESSRENVPHGTIGIARAKFNIT